MWASSGSGVKTKIRQKRNWPQVALMSVVFVIVCFPIHSHRWVYHICKLPLSSFGGILGHLKTNKTWKNASSIFHFLHICRKLQFLHQNLKGIVGWTNCYQFNCSDDVRIRIFAPKARLRDHATPSPHATKLCYDSLTSLYFLFPSVENLSPS